MKKLTESGLPQEAESYRTSSSKIRASRQLLTLLHRWAGLFLAVFLFISGVTGAIISWDHELDEWLNPHLFERKNSDEPLSSPLAIEPGYNLMLGVHPRLDPATGKLFDLDFNQIALDPVTGDIQGTRMWGEVSLSRENLLPFLYKLHYTMHIPDVFDIELGMFFMGILAIVWAVDCFIAL